MDLYAYGQIENLDELAKKNGIDIPRLRGYRLMSEMTPYTEEEIQKEVNWIYKDTIDLYTPADHFTILKTLRMPYDKREIKGRARACAKRARKQMETYNKYCGRDDVMMVHARLGDPQTWHYYGGSLISMEPWYLEKCIDGYDSTYCDIYVKIER